MTQKGRRNHYNVKFLRGYGVSINQMIKKKDYAWTREGNVVLDSDLIRRFLEVLERKFLSERPYKFRHGMKREDGMSMCQEITIAKISIQSFIDYCIRSDLHRKIE